jgi:HipA-like protein
MMPDVSVLEVLLYGDPVGTLTRVGGDRTLFAFDETYIADGDRPVLSLGFKDRLGELITEFQPTRTRVLPFFSNLLPEGHMRTYLAERAGVNPLHEFFLLRVLGRDLPGAITIRFFVLLCAHLRDEDLRSSYAAASTLWRRRSKPARPYMVRLMTFSRLICPSTGPVLQGSVKAACTASRS